MPDAEPAVSSTATEEAAPQSSPPIESWSAAQRDKWLSSGEIPAATEPEPAAPEEEKTSAAEPAESSAPESETGKSQEQRQQGRTRAETRKAELFAEIQDMLRQRHEARQELERVKEELAKAKPAGTKPAAETAPATLENGKPVPPDEENWTGTYPELAQANRAYNEAMAAWTAQQTFREHFAKAEQEKRERQQSEKWVSAASAEIKSNPQFKDAINVIGEFATRAGVADLIKDSDVGVDLVKYLWEHDEDGLRILTLGDKVAIAREFGRIESQLLANKKAPETKKISSASRPPTELSGASAAVEDEVDQALKAGDFERYARLQNARDAKSRR